MEPDYKNTDDGQFSYSFGNVEVVEDMPYVKVSFTIKDIKTDEILYTKYMSVKKLGFMDKWRLLGVMADLIDAKNFQTIKDELPEILKIDGVKFNADDLYNKLGTGAIFAIIGWVKGYLKGEMVGGGSLLQK